MLEKAFPRTKIKLPNEYKFLIKNSFRGKKLVQHFTCTYLRSDFEFNLIMYCKNK